MSERHALPEAIVEVISDQRRQPNKQVAQQGRLQQVDLLS
jgi:hypothetical protein